MDYDDVIELAAQTIYEADDPWASAWPWPMQGHPNSNPDAYRRIARAAAPILAEYGARLMREAVLPDVQTERTIENHGAHCRCTTCELNITEDSIRAIDPVAIVKEVVK
jgi:hypothetical protein